MNQNPIHPGENKEINLQIARLPTHTEIDIPIHVYRGLKDGPTLLISATIHGDEINGIEIIRRMREEKSLTPVSGTVISISIVNVFGFLQQSRNLPDGRDLNRCFPGTSDGTLASLIAYNIMTKVIPLIDYGIDLHTGGINRYNFPQVRCNLKNKASLNLARVFSPPFIVDSKERDKSFRAEVSKLRIPQIVYEAGEAQRLDEFSIIEGIQGIKRIMAHLEMTEDYPSSVQPTWIKTSRWLRARYGGIFQSFVKPGERVAKKQVIYSITDPYGDFKYVVKAPEKGHIIAVNYQPVIHKGDALLHLGIE
ncbi:MAG: succinylglutamate desuccinylase/aspartoacylase family protein [Spirochaetota bacterium]|nr:succinylglutamate desuccinylase/aspartoacylase family protein [Spirochaetota bacterium]